MAQELFNGFTILRINSTPDANRDFWSFVFTVNAFADTLSYQFGSLYVSFR